MSVLRQLASAQGWRDEVPNQDLARHLAETQDLKGIQEIVANLANGCIKTLYEVGYLELAMIADHCEAFLALLVNKNNRLVWGGMTAPSTIAHLRTNKLFPHSDEIQKALNTRSEITQESGILALSGIAAQGDDCRTALQPYWVDTLKTCRARDLPKHAEVVIDGMNAQISPAAPPSRAITTKR